MSFEGVYDFYRGRISSCPLYGFKSGHEILDVIVRCAGADNMLTDEEYNSIIKQAELCHIKMLEDDFNGGWN